MKANGTFPPAIELGSTPSGRIFHAFHHLQLVPTPDLLRLKRALELGSSEFDSAEVDRSEPDRSVLDRGKSDTDALELSPVRDLLQHVEGELNRRREQCPQAG